jgi:hypothetical protein
MWVADSGWRGRGFFMRSGSRILRGSCRENPTGCGFLLFGIWVTGMLQLGQFGFGMAITQDKPPSHALPPPRENSDGGLRPPSSFGPRKRSDGSGVAASGAEESVG